MKLPSALFQQGIQAGKIYYFSSDKINTLVPHYFICIARTEDEVVFLVCGTSQFEKRKKFIAARNLPDSTLVWIPPDEENGLTKDTYIDCNSNPLEYSVESLIRQYNEDHLSFKGEVGSLILAQIKTGLLDSPLIEDSLKELLRRIMQ